MTRRNTYQFTKYETNIIKGIAILMMLLHHCFTSPERYKGYQIIFSPFQENTINLVLSQYSGHRKCDFYDAPSA